MFKYVRSNARMMFGYFAYHFQTAYLPLASYSNNNNIVNENQSMG